MKKTMCELFAGVGGFRCGLNGIKTLDDIQKPEKWETVWFSQWEPAEKTTQYAHDCYVYHFGTCLDKNGNDTTNCNIEAVDKTVLPDFNLLTGGFPCQDYSVASTLVNSKGLEGKKGVLWWSIRDILEAKKPPFVLLENVDRLIKSPAKQRGRDFAVILACFRDENYTVEWRTINAAEYGLQQRRRRTFIFAYKNNTKYASKFKRMSDTDKLKKRVSQLLSKDGFFADQFPIKPITVNDIKTGIIPTKLGDVSSTFSFWFENSGIMRDGVIYTAKPVTDYNGPYVTLGDIMETEEVDKANFIPENLLYYTDPSVTHSDEMEEPLSKEERHTWQYIKGGKKIPRTAANGHVYKFAEGSMPMIDEEDKPARTMLTSEGIFGRSTHIVKDRKTGKIRLLTPEETERIQGFPTGHTKYCKVEDEIIEMPAKKRRFMMGNALVVNLIDMMSKTLDKIFENEEK